MNIELHINSPKFQVGDWVYLHHPMYKKKVPSMITQIRCFITMSAKNSPPKFKAREYRYVYFLHNIRETFFAETDLEKSVRDLAEEIENKRL